MPWVMLGRKVGMTQWFDGEGRALAATVVQVEPAVVVQIKTPEKDGYSALQLGAGGSRRKRSKSRSLGTFARPGSLLAASFMKCGFLTLINTRWGRSSGWRCSKKGSSWT